MRVLFSGRPGHGHLYPLLPLAFALRDAGSDVSFATGDEFVSRIAALGFPCSRVGISIARSEDEALERHPHLRDLPPDQKMLLGLTMFAEILPSRTIHDLVPLLEDQGPDVVVYEAADIGAPVAAWMTGTAAVCHSLGRPWPAPAHADLLARLATVAPTSIEGNPLYGDVYLDICPPSLHDPAAGQIPRRVGMRPVPWNEPPHDLPAWMLEARYRPLVYVTLGTVAFGAVEVLRRLLAGIAELDVDVLVAVGPRGDPEALGELPERFHVETFVPQAAVLPHVDVVVHHGGSGTTLGAASHGIPQLVAPQGADQFVNASALEASGAGLSVPPGRVDPRRVAACAGRLLEPGPHRRAAARLRAEIEALPLPNAIPEMLFAALRRLKGPHAQGSASSGCGSNGTTSA